MVGGGIVKEDSHVLPQKGTRRTTFSKKLTRKTFLESAEEAYLDCRKRCSWCVSTLQQGIMYASRLFYTSSLCMEKEYTKLTEHVFPCKSSNIGAGAKQPRVMPVAKSQKRNWASGYIRTGKIERFEEDFSYFTTICTLLKQGEEELLSIYPQYSTTRCSFTSAYVIRHTHTSAYVILIRQYTSAYISIRMLYYYVQQSIVCFRMVVFNHIGITDGDLTHLFAKIYYIFLNSLRAARNTVVILGILRNSRNFLRDQTHLPLNY